MKFAKVLEETLRDEEVPPEWKALAIPYKQLKKRINSVSQELAQLGLNNQVLHAMLDPSSVPDADGVPKIEDLSLDTLRELSPPPSEPHRTPVTALYSFDHSKTEPVPSLVITFNERELRLPSPEAEEDSVSAAVSQLLVASPPLAPTDSGAIPSGSVVPLDDVLRENENKSPSPSPPGSPSPSPGPLSSVEWVEHKADGSLQVVVHMKSDSNFFHMLYLELQALDRFKEEQEAAMMEKVQQLASAIARTLSRSGRRSDLYSWREVFATYVELQVFFRNNLFATQANTLTDVQLHFLEFLERTRASHYPEHFHQKQSKTAFQEFIALNYQLLRYERFQHINQVALTKILKKFDKRTLLTAKLQFPLLVKQDPFMRESLARVMCAAIHRELLPIVPNIDDYSCPVCMLIAWKPIRLACSHLFCVRCLVRVQRQKQEACPMCRAPCVMEADASNMDLALMELMKTYFPKEVKAKQKETEEELAREQYVAVYGEPKKCIMQ